MRKSHLATLVVVALATVGGRVGAGVPEFNQAGGPLVCDVRGEVHEDGYSFAIPEEFRGCMGWPRSIYIPLGTKAEDRFILVGWEYNAADNTDLQQANDRMVSYLASREGYSLLDRRWVKLGELKAERLLFSYRDENTGMKMTLAYLGALGKEIAEGPDQPELELFYSVSLTTPSRHYEEDAALFWRVVSSWHRARNGGK